MGIDLEYKFKDYTSSIMFWGAFKLPMKKNITKFTLSNKIRCLTDYFERAGEEIRMTIYP